MTWEAPIVSSSTCQSAAVTPLVPSLSSTDAHASPAHEEVSPSTGTCAGCISQHFQWINLKKYMNWMRIMLIVSACYIAKPSEWIFIKFDITLKVLDEFNFGLYRTSTTPTTYEVQINFLKKCLTTWKITILPKKEISERFIISVCMQIFQYGVFMKAQGKIISEPIVWLSFAIMNIRPVQCTK
jgi:hypothetical protein